MRAAAVLLGDADLYFPEEQEPAWDLGYLGLIATIVSRCWIA
jgi:hypothetical protein